MLTYEEKRESIKEDIRFFERRLEYRFGPFLLMIMFSVIVWVSGDNIPTAVSIWIIISGFLFGAIIREVQSLKIFILKQELRELSRGRSTADPTSKTPI